MTGLAEKLSGKSVPPETRLWEVFPVPATAHRLPHQTPRGDLRRILAQFEAFLNSPPQRRGSHHA